LCWFRAKVHPFVNPEGPEWIYTNHDRTKLLGEVIPTIQQNMGYMTEQAASNVRQQQGRHTSRTSGNRSKGNR